METARKLDVNALFLLNFMFPHQNTSLDNCCFGGGGGTTDSPSLVSNGGVSNSSIFNFIRRGLSKRGLSSSRGLIYQTLRYHINVVFPFFHHTVGFSGWVYIIQVLGTPSVSFRRIWAALGSGCCCSFFDAVQHTAVTSFSHLFEA